MGKTEGIIYRLVREKKLEPPWPYGPHHRKAYDCDLSQCKSSYPNVKFPTNFFVQVLIIEHPYWSPDDVLHHLKLRMKVRARCPHLFKSVELATGQTYLADFLEELKQELMSPEQLEQLKRTRQRRARIGSITECHWDKERDLLIYNVEEGDSWDGPMTQKRHLELLYEQREDI